MNIMMIKNELSEKMKTLLKKILEIEGVSTRQLSRISGIPVNTIWNFQYLTSKILLCKIGLKKFTS